MVLPARGGMGGSVEYQSNTLAAVFAKKLGGQYKMLHVPGQLRAEAAKTLINEPDVKSVIDYLKNTNILIYGMGIAEDMAVKRNLTSDQMGIIKREKAVAEAFGYFLQHEGGDCILVQPHWDQYRRPQAYPNRHRRCRG